MTDPVVGEQTTGRRPLLDAEQEHLRDQQADQHRAAEGDVRGPPVAADHAQPSDRELRKVSWDR